MFFDDIKDQDVPLKLVRNLLERDRIPNALLFWGPSGVGKGQTAMALAKSIMCSGDNSELAVRKIDHGNHPDLRIISPVKKSRIIDVDAIDFVIEMASLRPIESDWRVFIIHEADRMRGPAQNHLLKTLEEPLGKTLFILITEHAQILLPTIRSRCQRIRFGRLRTETVRDNLMRDRDLPSVQAEAIAAIAEGQMTRAFDLVDSDKREKVLDIIRRLSEKEDPLKLAEEFAGYLTTQRSHFESVVKASSDAQDINELSKEDRDQIKDEQAALADALWRRDIMEILYLIEVWFRDVMVYEATGDAEFIMNHDQLELLKAAETSRAEEKIEAVEKARLYLERFLNEERVVRDLFFTLAA